MLLFSDESEALTHPYLARAWAKRGADLRVPAPGQSKKVAMMGTLAWTQRKLIVTTSRTKRSTDFIARLQAHGPKPGTPIKPVVMVLDNGPIHVCKATRAALAEPLAHRRVAARNMHPNSPTSRSSGGDLKAHHLAHQNFSDPSTRASTTRSTP